MAALLVGTITLDMSEIEHTFYNLLLAVDLDSNNYRMMRL